MTDASARRDAEGDESVDADREHAEGDDARGGERRERCRVVARAIRAQRVRVRGRTSVHAHGGGRPVRVLAVRGDRGRESGATRGER